MNLHWKTKRATVALLLSLSACTSIPRVSLVFEAAPAEEVYPYYVLGTPYAALECECADIRVSITPVTLNTYEYFQAFISYHNNSDQPFHFYPLDSLTFSITDPVHTENTAPASPHGIIRDIDISKNTVQFFEALSAGVQAATVQPTSIVGPGGTYVVDDVAEKRQRILDRSGENLATAEWIGEGNKAAFNSTVLRRHTIFPGGSLAGFAYFPAKGQTAPWSYSERAVSDYIDGHHFEVTIHTACGVRTARFTPARGE